MVLKWIKQFKWLLASPRPHFPWRNHAEPTHRVCRVTDYRVTDYRVTDYMVNDCRVMDFWSPRAILRPIALALSPRPLSSAAFSLTKSCRIHATHASIGPRTHVGFSKFAIWVDHSPKAYYWNQILFSESLPNSSNSQNTSSAALHYLIAGWFWDPVYHRCKCCRPLLF